MALRGSGMHSSSSSSKNQARLNHLALLRGKKNASKLFRTPVFSEELNQPTNSAIRLIFLWDLLPPCGLATNFKSQDGKLAEVNLGLRGEAQVFNWHITSLTYQHHFCPSLKRFLCNQVTVETFHFLEFTIIVIKAFKLKYY